MANILLFRMLAILCVILCIFMLPALGVAFYYEERQMMQTFLYSFFLLFVPSIICILATNGSASRTLSIKEGFFLVTVAWLGLALYASLPFYLSGVFPTWGDCFFEASSGISTTGATAMVDIEASPKSILMWRSLIHWVGGMGIVVLTVAILPLLGIGGLQLFKAEAPGIESNKMTPRIAQTAKYLWFIYFTLTAVSFLLFYLGGMEPFDAINHAMSAIATGGFSTKNDSIGFYSSPFIHWAVTGSMFFAGVNFALLFSFFSGKLSRIYKDSEFKAYVLILLVSITFISIVLIRSGYHSGLDYEVPIRYAAFQAVSLMTSTGFATTDYGYWPSFTQFILFILMFIGGSAGSTAGGFKVVRIVVLIKQALIEMKHMIHPNGVFHIRLNDQVVNREIVYGVFGFFFLYMFLVALVAAVTTFSGADLLTAISTGFAMVGNIGPGFGNYVGPVGNYSFYPEYVKYVLSLSMLAGRLEIYTFMIVLTPYFWRRFK